MSGHLVVKELRHSPLCTRTPVLQLPELSSITNHSIFTYVFYYFISKHNIFFPKFVSAKSFVKKRGIIKKKERKSITITLAITITITLAITIIIKKFITITIIIKKGNFAGVILIHSNTQ